MKTLANLKEEIKQLSAQQLGLKNQRKTVNLVGERTIHPYNATYNHKNNRVKLFENYLILGKLKGMDLTKVSANYKDYFSEEYIDKKVAEYEQPAVRTDL